MKQKIVYLLITLFTLVTNGQEISKVTLEYKHPIRKEFAYLKIELIKKDSSCIMTKIQLNRKDLIDFFGNYRKKKIETILDCDSYNSIIYLIGKFEESSTKNILGYEGLQDPRVFALELIYKNRTENYESNIGGSFKTKESELKNFNEIIKQILTLAGYKWRKIL